MEIHNKKYTEKMFQLFDELHDNLVTVRNFVGCFSRICIDKIAEYKPDYSFQTEFTSYLSECLINEEKLTEEEIKEKVQKKLEELLSKYGITLKTFNQKSKEQITNGTKLGVELNSLEDKIDFYSRSQNHIFMNALENMITFFKDFLSSILYSYYLRYPESLNSKSIKFEIVSSSSSIDDLKEVFVQNEVEELFHKSIDEIFKTLINVTNIDLPFFDKFRKTILEFFYRRNIWVHNKGLVNRTYILLSGNPYHFEINNVAQISEEYLYDVASNLLLLGAEIVTNIISKTKFPPGTYDEEINSMSVIAFECYLEKEDWDFSQKFYEILINNFHLSDLSHDLYKLNIMLCKKKTNQTTVSKIKKEKWDSKSTFLQIGFRALTEEYELLSNLLVNQKVDENFINVEHLKTWPIFIDFRKDPLFETTVETMKTIYKI